MSVPTKKQILPWTPAVQATKRKRWWQKHYKFYCLISTCVLRYQRVQIWKKIDGNLSPVFMVVGGTNAVQRSTRSFDWKKKNILRGQGMRLVLINCPWLHVYEKPRIALNPQNLMFALPTQACKTFLVEKCNLSSVGFSLLFL